MPLRNIIELITQKHHETGIELYPPASFADINMFEKQIGFPLPADFKEFYSICNGFGCNEDIFNLTSLGNIMRYGQDYGTNWFYFAEYMIYSDMWGLRLTEDGIYQIFNGSYPSIVMTSSFEDFLARFLAGNVFDKDGLYDWHKELKIN